MERISKVDLLVQTSLDELLLILKLLLTLLIKQATLMEEVNRTEPSPSESVPWLDVSSTSHHF